MQAIKSIASIRLALYDGYGCNMVGIVLQGYHSDDNQSGDCIHYSNTLMQLVGMVYKASYHFFKLSVSTYTCNLSSKPRISSMKKKTHIVLDLFFHINFSFSTLLYPYITLIHLLSGVCFWCLGTNLAPHFIMSWALLFVNFWRVGIHFFQKFLRQA